MSKKTTMHLSQALFWKFCLCLVTALGLLCGCAKTNGTLMPIHETNEPTSTLTPTPTQTIISDEQTPTMESQTPSPTATDDWGVIYNSGAQTQEPAIITTHEPSNNKYLYKYANVTFFIPFRNESSVRLNLDDLNDNGKDNSDLILLHSTGTGGTSIEIYPINHSTDYYSDLHSMSYDSCMEHFPFTNMDADFYDDQAWKAGSQRDYCVITNEGRLSVIRYVQDTFIPSDYDHVYLELVVTTFNQKIPEALALQPTHTPGPTSTPGRYSGMNLTNKQISVLDQSVQIFLDAVKAHDKEKVADLIEYPLAISYKGNEEPVFIENREAFLVVYDGFFTHDVVEEFNNATVQNNTGQITDLNYMGIHVESCDVYFHPDGRIFQFVNTYFNQE